jgi:hypothetical protein
MAVSVALAAAFAYKDAKTLTDNLNDPDGVACAVVTLLTILAPLAPVLGVANAILATPRRPGFVRACLLPIWFLIGCVLWELKLLCFGPLALYWASMISTKENLISRSHNEAASRLNNAITLPGALHCKYNVLHPGTRIPAAIRKSLVQRLEALSDERRKEITGGAALVENLLPRFDLMFDLRMFNRMLVFELVLRAVPRFGASIVGPCLQLVQQNTPTSETEEIGINWSAIQATTVTAIMLFSNLKFFLHMWRERLWSVTFDDLVLLVVSLVRSTLSYIRLSLGFTGSAAQAEGEIDQKMPFPGSRTSEAFEPDAQQQKIQQQKMRQHALLLVAARKEREVRDLCGLRNRRFSAEPRGTSTSTDMQGGDTAAESRGPVLCMSEVRGVVRRAARRRSLNRSDSSSSSDSGGSSADEGSKRRRKETDQLVVLKRKRRPTAGAAVVLRRSKRQCAAVMTRGSGAQ